MKNRSDKAKKLLAPTCYEVLGATRKTSLEELRENYLALAREHHPDRNGGTQEANDFFATVTSAYHTLRDPTARKLYDARLDLLKAPCPKCRGAGETYKQKGFTGRTATPCPECSGSGRVN
jgi:DnaJ-class molecular chaperone